MPQVWKLCSRLLLHVWIAGVVTNGAAAILLQPCFILMPCHCCLLCVVVRTCVTVLQTGCGQYDCGAAQEELHIFPPPRKPAMACRRGGRGLRSAQAAWPAHSSSPLSNSIIQPLLDWHLTASTVTYFQMCEQYYCVWVCVCVWLLMHQKLFGKHRNTLNLVPDHNNASSWQLISLQPIFYNYLKYFFTSAAIFLLFVAHWNVMHPFTVNHPLLHIQLHSPQASLRF